MIIDELIDYILIVTDLIYVADASVTVLCVNSLRPSDAYMRR